MILNSHSVAQLLKDRENTDPFVLAPTPNLQELEQSGAASVDLRLGTWFVTTRASKHPVLRLSEDDQHKPSEHRMTTKHYIRFGDEYYLHPHSFVLASTLEWIRMPRGLAGYVTGKSSWGRRGLIIETAPGVHPGFVGCLTLELTNVGQVPIAINPGTPICQIFVHKVEGDTSRADKSPFVGRRQPILGNLKLDDFTKRLRATGSAGQ